VHHFKQARKRHGGSEHGVWHPHVEHDLPAVGGGESLKLRFQSPLLIDGQFSSPIIPQTSPI
jgi:hypothetical protein